METMNRHAQKKTKFATSSESQEVCGTNEWEFINMSDQEEDLICRMYRLVGDRWDLIAGRIPGRKAEEIERFWIMRHRDMFADRRKQQASEEFNSKLDAH